MSMLLRPGLGIERQFLFGTTLSPKIIVIVARTLSSNSEVAVMQILKLIVKESVGVGSVWKGCISASLLAMLQIHSLKHFLFLIIIKVIWALLLVLQRVFDVAGQYINVIFNRQSWFVAPSIEHLVGFIIMFTNFLIVWI